MDDELDSIIDILNEQGGDKFQPAKKGGFFLERPGMKSAKASDLQKENIIRTSSQGLPPLI